MCPPAVLAAASLAISAVSTVMQYESQKETAEQQEAMILDGQAKERAATQRQYQQIQESSMDEQAQRHTEYLIDQARIKAIGAESGLSGGTQDRIEAEAENSAATDMATIESNRKRQSEQAASQGMARTTQANVQLSGIRKPSALGAGLQIAGAAMGSYDMYEQRTAAQKVK